MAQDQSVGVLSEEKEQRSRLLEIQIVAVFFLLLFGLDTFRVLVVLPWEARLPDALATVVEVFVKGSIFIGLTLLCVAYVEKPKEGIWGFLKLKQNVGRGVAVGLAGSLLLVLVFLVFAPKPVGANSLNGFSQIVLAGILEEVAFRGYLLQKFQSWMDYNAAILLTSVLFVCIHLPLWLSMGNGVKVLLVNAAAIFFLSILLGLAVRVSNSLWAAIAIHTANNLIQLFL